MKDSRKTLAVLAAAAVIGLGAGAGLAGATSSDGGESSEDVRPNVVQTSPSTTQPQEEPSGRRDCDHDKGGDSDRSGPSGPGNGRNGSGGSDDRGGSTDGSDTSSTGNSL